MSSSHAKIRVGYQPTIEELTRVIFRRHKGYMTTLHICMPHPHDGVFCGADGSEVEVVHLEVTRDDLICGPCMDRCEEFLTQNAEATPISQPLSYQDYLKSDHWQHMREIAREHYGNTCCLCGTEDQLDVHHRTYERRGRERLSDVILLCRDCHSRYHAKAS
jgi:hypothetical protein